MIKVTGKRPIRSTTAAYVTDDGEEVQITVEYFSPNQAYLQQRMIEAQKADEDYQKKLDAANKAGKQLPPRLLFSSEELARDIHALRDPDGNPFADENGKTLKINAANLAKIDQRNLNAIRQAINEDIAGKKSQPAE